MFRAHFLYAIGTQHAAEIGCQKIWNCVQVRRELLEAEQEFTVLCLRVQRSFWVESNVWPKVSRFNRIWNLDLWTWLKKSR
jgi:hypothetical protein